MAGALDFARAGGLTRAWKTTLENIGDQFRAECVEEALVRTLADAQTSGGLLLAAPALQADALLAMLQAAGVQGVEIGRALTQESARVRLRA